MKLFPNLIVRNQILQRTMNQKKNKLLKNMKIKLIH